MTGYNGNNCNVPWYPDNGGYAYHSQAGHNGHRADHTSDNRGFMDATTRNEGEDFHSSVEACPDSMQDDNNDNNNLAAAAAAVAVYQPFRQELFVDENSDAGSPYRSRGQYSEEYLRSISEDAASQAPFSWNYHSQQTTAMFDPPMTQWANKYENNVASQEELVRAFHWKTTCGGMEQQPPVGVDDKRTPYHTGGVPDGGFAYMASNNRYDSSLIAERTNFRVPQQPNQYQGFQEAQSNTHFNPQSHTSMAPFLAGYAEAQTQYNIHSYDAPWSPENKRHNEQRGPLDGMTSKVVRNSSTSETHSGVTGYGNTDSILTDDLNTSATSLNSDVDMIASLETLRGNKQSFAYETPRVNLRECTPGYEPEPSSENDRDPSSLSAEYPGWPPARQPLSSNSEASSPVSSASPSMPDAIHCGVCFTEFTGKYRKGNLARHVRRKHKGKGVVKCEDDNCSKIFQREDARLKHYRKYHPYLVEKPIVPRGPRRPSHPQTPAGAHEPQDQVLSNVAGWTGWST